MADAKTTNFLYNNKITPDAVDMESVVKYILKEMKRSQNGGESSLAMINSYLKPSFNIEGNKRVLVIDAGGTNFRTCLVKFDENLTPSITQRKNYPMPGIVQEISAHDFFEEIAERIEPLIDETDNIGFCFSYAAKCLPNHDAVPLFFSKEIKAPEVVGQELGRCLFHHLEMRGHNMLNKHIVILNDTVATLLASVPFLKEHNADFPIGFILGTGTNCAHISADGFVINEESGCLDLNISELDNAFLQTTQNPALYKMEKMISGAYLGPLALFILREAQKNGVLSEDLVLPANLTSADVSEFLKGDCKVLHKCLQTDSHSDTCSDSLSEATISDSDYNAIKEILENLVLRTAKLTACMIAGSVLASNEETFMYDKIDAQRNINKDNSEPRTILINADGTTFYAVPKLKEAVEENLSVFLEKYNIAAKFIKIDSSPIIGSAIAALCV